MREAMLKVDDLSFAYGAHQVLDQVRFSVRRSSVCALFGPNGSGKTTLFRSCLGLLKASGTVTIDGASTRSLRPSQLSRLVSYVPQEHKPPFPYSVFDVVLTGRTPHLGAGIFRVAKSDSWLAMQAIERLGIGELAAKSYLELSGGQRQLVLIARALAQDTPLMLLDEPTSALDFNNQVKVWGLLREIAAAGTTVVACVHDPNHVSWFCDDVVMMHEGRVLASGPTEEVFTQRELNTLYADACDVVALADKRVVVPRMLLNGPEMQTPLPAGMTARTPQEEGVSR